MNMRKLEERIFVFLMRFCSFIILALLCMILFTILSKGIKGFNWDMILKTPQGGFYTGRKGGILNAIIGSAYIGLGGVILGLLISLPIILYLHIFAKKNSLLVQITRFCFDVLWGIPSIVYGAFGFSLMLYLGLKVSLLGGIVTVALLVLPILARMLDEVVALVSKELTCASFALGATRFETAFRVVIRQALPGLLTAIIIAFGRGVGDAASVLYTAGFTDNIPDSLFSPAATLPLAIFFQLGTPYPEVQNRAYSAALILTVFIFIINVIIRILNLKLAKNTIK